MSPDRRAVPADYDEDPERFRLARSVRERYAAVPDVHETVARRLLAERLVPVLDVGCEERELARHLPAGAWTGVDSSAEMLARAPAGTVQGDAAALPFGDASFPSVALAPHVAVQDAHDRRRVGRTAASARDNQPVARSVVRLPAAVRAPFEVYLNGVRQQPGTDFTIEGRALVFDRELRIDRISKWRWFLGAWGVGTYRQDDSVDVRYERPDGTPAVAEKLEIELRP